MVDCSEVSVVEDGGTEDIPVVEVGVVTNDVPGMAEADTVSRITPS